MYLRIGMGVFSFILLQSGRILFSPVSKNQKSAQFFLDKHFMRWLRIGMGVFSSFCNLGEYSFHLQAKPEISSILPR
jgi:hypothetical protein